MSRTLKGRLRAPGGAAARAEHPRDFGVVVAAGLQRVMLADDLAASHKRSAAVVARAVADGAVGHQRDTIQAFHAARGGTVAHELRWGHAGNSGQSHGEGTGGEGGAGPSACAGTRFHASPFTAVGRAIVRGAA